MFQDSAIPPHVMLVSLAKQFVLLCFNYTYRRDIASALDLFRSLFCLANTHLMESF